MMQHARRNKVMQIALHLLGSQRAQRRRGLRIFQVGLPGGNKIEVPGPPFVGQWNLPRIAARSGWRTTLAVAKYARTANAGETYAARRKHQRAVEVIHRLDTRNEASAVAEEVAHRPNAVAI